MFYASNDKYGEGAQLRGYVRKNYVHKISTFVIRAFFSQQQQQQQ
jgi:hypothetical protein